jgi:hypothetical protein
MDLEAEPLVLGVGPHQRASLQDVGGVGLPGAVDAQVGRGYPTSAGARGFPPLITPAASEPAQLSFWNLVEAHVLRSFRADHGVSVKALSQALDYAEKELRIKRLLLRKEICANAGQVLLDRYGQLIDLSASRPRDGWTAGTRACQPSTQTVIEEPLGPRRRVSLPNHLGSRPVPVFDLTSC